MKWCLQKEKHNSLLWENVGPQVLGLFHSWGGRLFCLNYTWMVECYFDGLYSILFWAKWYLSLQVTAGKHNSEDTIEEVPLSKAPCLLKRLTEGWSRKARVMEAHNEAQYPRGTCKQDCAANSLTSFCFFPSPSGGSPMFNLKGILKKKKIFFFILFRKENIHLNKHLLRVQLRLESLRGKIIWAPDIIHDLKDLGILLIFFDMCSCKYTLHTIS